MFKKLLTASFLLATSSSVAIAYPVYKDTRYNPRYSAPYNPPREVRYVPRQEMRPVPRMPARYTQYDARRDYKGEYIPPAPPSSVCYNLSPYLGLSAGPRINYSGAPSVYHGLEGIISGGFSATSPNFYLAAEIFGGDSVKLKNYNAPGDGSIRSTWTIGLSAIPGFLLTDNLWAYARAGIQRTHFRNNWSTDCNCSNGKDRNGWHVGLGGQSNLDGGWDVRAEYVYSQYNKIYGLGRPRSHQFNFGLIFRCM